MFDFLSDLERSLATVIKGVGKIKHQFWRSYHSEIRTEPSESFVDGDLIETFLDLSKCDMVSVVDGLKVYLHIIKLKNVYYLKCYVNQNTQYYKLSLHYHDSINILI